MTAFEIGPFLKRVRVDRKIKMQSAADAVGVSLATWSHWESGRRQPHLDNLLALAQFLDISPSCLVCLKNGHCSGTSIGGKCAGGKLEQQEPCPVFIKV